MLLSSCNMLNHVGLEYYGGMIQNAVHRVLKTGKVCYFFHSLYFILLAH